MNKLPLISIITPSLNQGRFIEETILSVKFQDYPHIEHIVIDGGSTDETIDVLKKYENQYNLKWISEPDKGQSDALNKGLRMAKGKIIGWLNSDDTYQPQAVKKIVETFLKYPEVDIIYGKCNFINENNEISGSSNLKPFTLKALSKHQLNPSVAVFYQKGVFEKIGDFNFSLQFVMDYDFYIRIAKKRLNIKGIDIILANFRSHFLSKTFTLHNWRREDLTIFFKYFSPSTWEKPLARFATAMVIEKSYNFEKVKQILKKELLNTEKIKSDLIDNLVLRSVLLSKLEILKIYAFKKNRIKTFCEGLKILFQDPILFKEVSTLFLRLLLGRQICHLLKKDLQLYSQQEDLN